MDDAALARNLVLAWPLALTALAAGVRQARAHDLMARVPAAFLASVWVWTAVHAVEAATAWWTYAPSPASLFGVPAEVALGWALLWGAVPVLTGGPAWLWLPGLAWIDLLVMRLAPDLVTLGPDWLLGEALLLAVALLPALALGRATLRRTCLPVRVTLQAVLFLTLFGWLVPTFALTHEGLGWADVVDHSYAVRSLLLTAAVIVGLPGLAAVVEIARAGGTPFPWDPPQRLVTSGPYAHVSNPMQIAIAGMMTVLTVAAGSWLLAAATVFSLAFSEFLAERHEVATLTKRWHDYVTYRRHVRAWLPRWRPWQPETTTLWVDESCALCTATGVVVERLHPSHLVLHAAEDSPTPLTRMRWEGRDSHDDGVAAFARALEQTSLPWAWLGWWMRLPLVNTWLQLIADACGLGPRVPGPRNPTPRTLPVVLPPQRVEP
jgi:protein-S-isoprenylcysteine O-methyltransferase Ste14